MTAAVMRLAQYLSVGWLSMALLACGAPSDSSPGDTGTRETGPDSARACCLEHVGGDAGTTACRSLDEARESRRCRGNEGCTALTAPSCGCDCRACWDGRCVVWRRTECASGGGGSGPCPPE